MSTGNTDIYLRISELAREMSEHMPADATSALDELVRNAVEHIPGANYAGITVVARRGEAITTPAATDEHPRTLDALQQKQREGPCFAAATEHDSYFIRDMHTEERWPSFQSDAIDLGYVFAAHAAVVWGTLQRSEQFQSALASRDIIGQAKGMVMERYNVNAIQAFELLRRLSQDSNVRLFEVADRVVKAEHPPAPGSHP